MKKQRSDRELAEDIVSMLNSEQDKTRHPDMKIKSLLQQARNAGDGPLRMQYLQQAQKEIAKLDQTRNGNRTGRLQGEVLALQGRGGDTRIAHVTPGEIVIPQRLQTPQLLTMLHLAARALGVDPARLVVGSDHNSINPQTGQAEFDDDGSDDGIESITVTAPKEDWSPDDYHWGEILPMTEAANQHDPQVAQAVISTAINRVGQPDYAGSATLSGAIQAPKQFQGINSNANQPWRALQNPSEMTDDEKATFDQYRDIVHQRMTGQLPDNTGGATYLFHGEPSDEELARMSKYPLVQTARIGGFTFYKPNK